MVATKGNEKLLKDINLMKYFIPSLNLGTAKLTLFVKTIPYQICLKRQFKVVFKFKDYLKF